MYSVIAIVGSRLDLSLVIFPPEVQFDERIEIVLPDDHGEFPDTSGYNRNDFEKIRLTEEDSQLYPYMLKCIDVVDNYGNKKLGQLEKLNYEDVKFTMHGHTFGGKVFAVVGFVDGRPPRLGSRQRFIHVN